MNESQTPSVTPEAPLAAATVPDPGPVPAAPLPPEGLPALAEQAAYLLDVGGPVLLILLGLSVLTLTIVLLKLWQFVRLRLGARAFVDRALSLWRDGRRQEALVLLAAQPNPMAPVLRTALLGNLCKDDAATLREELLRQAGAVLAGLRAWLRPLELIATLSPLLGLLGTVLGMISAFQRLESAGAQVDPSILSGGIWEALLTTAAGLVVAIPAVVAHTGLERLVEGFAQRMEDAVTRVLTGSLRLAEPAQPRPVALRQPEAVHAS